MEKDGRLNGKEGEDRGMAGRRRLANPGRV
jgi:hypothetical protein